MANLTDDLRQAVALHRAGRLDDATRMYRKIIEVDANHAQAWHMLGVAEHQSGHNTEALEHIRRAIGLNATDPLFHVNLSTTLLALGREGDAIDSLREVIRLQPDRVKSHMDLGLLLVKSEQYAEASDAFRDAVRLAAEVAEGHYNLGQAQKNLGRFEDAIASYRAALQLRPDFLEAQFALGRVYLLRGQWREALPLVQFVATQRADLAEAQHALGAALRGVGRLDEAHAALHAALQINPNLAEAVHTLGQTLADQQQYDAAVAAFDRAIKLKPELLESHFGLSMALRELGHFDAAARIWENFLEARPNDAPVHANLGLIRLDQRRFEDAQACQREALRLDPQMADAHNNLAMALQAQGKFDEAIASLREALRLKPDFGVAHNNLAALLSSIGRPQEALECIEELVTAISQKDASPDQLETRANAYMHRGITRLLLGNFAGGWPDYEWRLRMRTAPRLPWTQPTWDGSPLNGRTIMLHPEQGNGDALQFVRYAPLVKQRGGRVIVACPKSLIPILSTCPGIDDLFPWDSPLPKFDVRAAFMSLPFIFKTDLDSIPADVPYLKAEDALVARFQQSLVTDNRFLIGINWQGNPANQAERFRSIPLAAFAPLAEVAGVRLIGLQKGWGVEDIANCSFPLEDLGSQLDEHTGAFVETAAVVKNLDLVITSDTALAHLAGALAAPTWLPLCKSSEWRWLLDRDDSPWYPSLRLFRQTTLGDWSDVFTRIAGELSKLAAQKAKRS